MQFQSFAGSQYSTAWVMKNLKISDPNLANAKVIQDANRYVDMHTTLFGTFEYGLMRKPEDYVWQYVTGTVFEFLQRNDLLSLIPLFQILFHTNGYE